MRKSSLAAALFLVLGAPAQARPVVLELFTSQACSSCPPADALLGALQSRSADVLALSFHVTYWNGPGWTDPYSSPQATTRQRAYAAALGTEVFTPQLVVDAATSVVGSDEGAVQAAIDRARQRQAAGPALVLAASPAGLRADVGAGAGQAQVLLVGYDPAHSTAIAGGENGGVTLQETNVVRSLRAIGLWDGAPLHLDIALPAGRRAALILQRADGVILGAATLQ